MGLGVLESSMKDVPGTAILQDETRNTLESANSVVNATNLKHGKGKYSHTSTIRRPQRPLNWSGMRRWSCLLSITFAMTVVGVVGPLLSPGIVVIATELNLTLSEAAQATSGWLTFALAASTILYGPLMIKFGRRPVFLLASLFLVIGNFVSWKAKTAAVLTAGRAIVGLGMGPAECLVGAVIADLFFTHERGIPVAVYQIATLNGINIAPPLAGIVINRHGWRTPSLIAGIFSIICFLAQFFYQPETLYIRKAPSEGLSANATDDGSAASNSGDEKATVEPAQRALVPTRHSYLSTLKPWSGVYPSKASFIALIFRPFLLLPSPIVVWAFLCYGVGICFIVFIAINAAAIFAPAPYFFGPEQTGEIYFSPFITSFLAAMFAGPAADWMTRHMTKRNGGVYEPEFKLPLIVIYALFEGCGFLGWAYSTQKREAWIIPVVCFGIAQFGLVVGSVISLGYVVDSFGAASTSALTATMALKNFFAYGVSYYASPWLERDGPLKVFGTIAGIHVAIGLLTIPMYIYGKRCRALMARLITFEDEGGPGAH